MGFKTIQNSDYSNRLIANLPTRPNASPGNFGGGGLTAVQMKQAYDAMPLFIIGRLNALIEYINGTGDERLSDAILASLKNVIADNIPTGISEEIKTLTGLFNSIKSGELAKVLFVPSGQKPLNEMIGVLNEYESKFNDYDSKYSRFESVSTSLLGFEPRLSRVEKQVENFYKGGALPVIIDDAVAYSKVVPEGALPYAEVAKVGGMSYASDNLAVPNKGTFNNNGFIASVDANARLVVTGSAAASANTVIELALADANGPRTHVTLAAGVTYSLSAYKDGAPLSLDAYVHCKIDYTDAAGGTGWSWGGQDVSRPREVSMLYIQVDVEAGSTALCGTYEVMLNEGSTALPYSPYFEGLRHAKPTVIKSVGANLFDISRLVNTTGIKVYDDKIVVTAPAVDSSVSSTVLLKDVAPQLKVGDVVTINAVTQGEPYIWLDGVWSFGSSKTITAEMLNSAVYFYAKGVSTTATISEIMLNFGSAPLPYRPHTEYSLPIPSAVQSLPDYGLGVSATVNNHIDWSERKYHRTCGEVDMGTLDWNGFGGYFAHTGSIFKPSANVISAIPSPFDTIRVDIYGALVVTFVDGIFTSSDDVKSAMSGVMLVYELANPEVTDISHLLPEDNLIPVEGGGQIVVENEHNLAAPTEIIYQIKEATA